MGKRGLPCPDLRAGCGALALPERSRVLTSSPSHFFAVKRDAALGGSASASAHLRDPSHPRGRDIRLLFGSLHPTSVQTAGILLARNGGGPQRAVFVRYV